MEDHKSTGETLDKCPVCQGKILVIGDNEHGCNNCGRIWMFIQGGWVSKARKVVLIREPREGDSPDDFLRPINED